jgi:hypothetical protein
MISLIIFIVAFIHCAHTASFAVGNPEKKAAGLDAALEGRNVLRFPANDYSDKTPFVKGEFKEFDAAVVDIIDGGDFKRFMNENGPLLLKFCADEYFGAMLLELAEIECKKLDCYVTSGEEDPRDALRGGVYDFPAMLEFIEKIRVMNYEIKNAHKKIRIKSVHCAMNKENPARVARIIKRYDETAANDLLWLIKHLSGDNFNKLKPPQRKELSQKAAAVHKAIVKNRIKITADHSRDEYLKSLMQLDIIKLLMAYFEKKLEFKSGIDHKNEAERMKKEIVIKYIEYYCRYDLYNKGIIIFNESVL